MNNETTAKNPPSPRAVSLARDWLAFTGIIFLLFGIPYSFSSTGGILWLSFFCIAIGIFHLGAAHFASARVALGLAWFLP
jgi:hypothetical protein